mgnify:CR=1 FL=1
MLTGIPLESAMFFETVLPAGSVQGQQYGPNPCQNVCRGGVGKAPPLKAQERRISAQISFLILNKQYDPQYKPPVRLQAEFPRRLLAG